MNNSPWWSQNATATENTKHKNHASPLKGAIGVASVFGLVVATMVGFLVAGPDPQAPYESQFNSISYPIPVEDALNNCGDIFTFSPPQDFYGAIPDKFMKDPENDTYISRRVPRQPMTVPAYGFFIESDAVFTKKFFTLDDKDEILTQEYYLKLMWDGWSIIWYDSDVVEEEAKTRIKAYVESHDKMVAMPWTGERSLPMNRGFAFSSWNVTQSCDTWNEPTVDRYFEFVKNYDAGNRNKEIPWVDIEYTQELPLIDPDSF